MTSCSVFEPYNYTCHGTTVNDLEFLTYCKNGSCFGPYRFFKTGGDWKTADDAATFCQAIAQDGSVQLAMLETEAEFAGFSEIVQIDKTYPGVNPYVGYWIGLRRPEIEEGAADMFRWSSGQELESNCWNQSPWEDGEPSGYFSGLNEDCVEIWPSGKLNDNLCTDVNDLTNRQFICEYIPSGGPTTNPGAGCHRLQFVEQYASVTSDSGDGRGTLAVDFNGDELLDIYVVNMGYRINCFSNKATGTSVMAP